MRLPVRHELTPVQRCRRAAMQLLLWLGLLLTTKGLTSAAYWLAPDPRGLIVIGPGGPFRPAVAIIAIFAGPLLCVAAGLVADRRAG